MADNISISIPPTPPTKDIITIQNTRVLMPSEYHKLRKAMVDESKALVEEWNHQLADARGRAEWDREKKLREKINTANKYPLMCDYLLHTGMRLVEARAFKPEWYRASRRVVVIPEGACKKVKCTFTQRTVMLSLPGCDAVEAWQASGLKMPSRTAMWLTLKRYAELSGIGSEYITAKMFRKTLASWLMACYPEMEMYISASMGHDRTTLQKHYLGHGFPRSEIELAREMLQGWGVAT